MGVFYVFKIEQMVPSRAKDINFSRERKFGQYTYQR